MMPEFGKSFVNKKNAKSAVEMNRSPSSSSPVSKPISFQSIISVLAVFLSGFAVLAIVGLSFFLESNITSIAQQIETEQEAFKLDTIRTLDAFDRQVNTFKSLVQDRVVYTFFIDRSAELVTPNTKYESITIRNDGDSYNVSIDAVSSSFSAYLQQTRVLFTGSSILVGGQIGRYSITNERGISFSYNKDVSKSDVISRINSQ